MHAQLLQSCIQLFVTLWTVAHQAPLSMRFSRKEYWSELPCPSPGNTCILCPSTLPPRIYLNLLWIYTKMYENTLWTSVDHCVLLYTVQAAVLNWCRRNFNDVKNVFDMLSDKNTDQTIYTFTFRFTFTKKCIHLYLYVLICMCVCTYICMCVCIYIYIYVCVCVYIYI